MSNFSPAKRALFRQLTSQAVDFMRPPWAIEEYEFVNACTACNACSEACETSIIKLDKRNQPYIDFTDDECTFCTKCLQACTSGALQKSARPWNASARVVATCFAQNQVHCRSCSDVCEQQAISFALSAHGISPPDIKIDQCTGCGACVSICPNRAIEIRYN